MIAHDDALAAGLRERLTARARTLHDPGARRAAVAVAVARGAGGGAHLLLTKRAARMRAHPGQWALPGGRIDAGETAAGAALRELDEELGIPRDAPVVLGRLDDYASKSGYVISPVIVWLDGDVTPVANPDEVASAHALALDDLDVVVPLFADVPGADGPVLQLPLFGTRIHAPTAAILVQFRERALHGRDIDANAFHEPPFAWR